jgi:hypothetical protein
MCVGFGCKTRRSPSRTTNAALSTKRNWKRVRRRLQTWRHCLPPLRCRGA